MKLLLVLLGQMMPATAVATFIARLIQSGDTRLTQSGESRAVQSDQ